MTKVLVFSKSNPIKDWEAAKWNLQFLCVESQQEAIHMLETNTIHVVVVDIEEREQEGLAFVSCLRGLQRFYLLPVILLAKDDTYESLAFHVFHCFDYVIKPIEKERLEKLLHWIDGRFDNKGAVLNGQSRSTADALDALQVFISWQLRSLSAERGFQLGNAAV